MPIFSVTFEKTITGEMSVAANDEGGAKKAIEGAPLGTFTVIKEINRTISINADATKLPLTKANELGATKEGRIFVQKMTEVKNLEDICIDLDLIDPKEVFDKFQAFWVSVQNLLPPKVIS